MEQEVLVKVVADFSGVESEFRDNSKLWEQHEKDIKNGQKAMTEYQKSLATSGQKLNDQIKTNITNLGNEAKQAEKVQKQFESLSKKNQEAFDPSKLDLFNQALKQVSDNMGSIENLNLNIEDFDKLLSLLSGTEDDFEALNLLVGFFEDKMKSAAVGAVGSFEEVQKKIDETKLNIKSTEDFIKDINKRIPKVAPGQDQANLISERNAAEQALKEEKVALADYTAQLKKSRQENVTMTTQLRKLKDELIALELAGGRGSDRWVELTAKAEEYNTAIKSTNQELNRQASSTEQLDNVIGAVSGIIGVYSAAEGAAALFGDESEDLQKSLVRLNGAIALLNGLQAIQVELAKKETIAGRALAFVKGQYALATDASAAATTRLAAATKLLGIGLLVGALAAIVVNWEKIAKAIGLVNIETESLNDIQEKSIENTGAEIGRLKALQSELENTNTTQKRQAEIKADLLKQYPGYLKALGDEKSSAEDIESAFKNLNDALILNSKITAAREILSDEFKKVLEAERKAIEGEASTYQTVVNSLSNISFNAEKAQAGFEADNAEDARKNLAETQKEYDDFSKFITDFIVGTNQELEKLGGDPTKDAENLNDRIKTYDKFSDLLRELVDRQEEYRLNAIENGREREKAILNARLEAEKQAYLDEINALEVSQDRKLQLLQEFNKIYNEQTGAAYEQLQKDLLAIDQKYDEERRAALLKAQEAIDSVFKTEAEIDRKAIQERFDAIRKELENQIKKTNSELEKNQLRASIAGVDEAEDAELQNFDLNTDLDRLDREKKIADSILAIQQANVRDIIQNEELKQLQLLKLEESYLSRIISTYKNSFKSLQEQNLFASLTDQLLNSTDPEEIQNIADELRNAFGDGVAEEILDVAAALKEVGNEIDDLGQNERLNETVNSWIGSFDAFSQKLTEVILDKFPDIVEKSGVTAQEFASSLSATLSSTYDSIRTIFDLEINEYQRRVDAFQQSIDDIQTEVDREQQLYEDGYANNFEARQQDLENLKEQKRQEEEELQKAQKKKAALQKAEFLLDTVSQLSNLITASTSIFKWASKIPIIGVPLAIGLIGTMFGAFALAKTTAFQAIGQSQQFRRGLHEGAVQLDGPSHERGGYGVYNSETGEKVAEFEGREKVYVLNATQQKKYGRHLEAMIEAEKGGRSIRDGVMDLYSIPKLGPTTTKIVERANDKILIAQNAKQESSIKDNQTAKDLKDIKKFLNDEFGGHKKDQKNKTESWETKTHFVVKKGNVIKKYKKDES